MMLQTFQTFQENFLASPSSKFAIIKLQFINKFMFVY